MSYYNGFSTERFLSDKSFVLKGVDLVRQDLLTNINTRYGERVKMPTFGTKIPDLIFEQLSDKTVVIVHQELKKVFDFDPRVKLIDLQVIPLYDQKSILALATIYYFDFDFTETTSINIQFQY